MSEGDVSTIRDEDVLRRMWQQTEDFSRKKEIRAHMYRLREERLRNLYSPEPAAHPKGVESAMHVSSLLDQSFQGLKSKEVRDAGSPPKEYAADLKELSNAGWNVESEDRTTDDGHTQIRAVRADIEGRYDVAGGKGEFAAKDVQQRARTQYRDDAGSTTRDEATAHSAARDHVVQQTPDGALRTSTTSSSSTSTSKVEHVTSSQRVPYVTEPAEITQRGVDDSDVRRVTTTSDYEQSLRKNDVESGELMSRKVEYPDDDTRVIVETRRLADGTRVTSTRKEFRAPAQSTRSERHSSKSETRSYSSSAQHHDESRDSAMTTRRVDIVDSQRQHDDEDFRRNRTQHISREDNRSETEHRHHQTAENRQLETRQSSSKITRETVDSRNTTDLKKRVDDSTANVKVDHTTSKDDSIKQQNRRFETNIKDTDQRDVIVKDVNRNQQTEYSTTQRTYHTDNKVDETDRREFITTHDKNIHRDVNETQYIKNNEEKNHNITRDQKVEEVIEKKSSDQYQTTYQSDFTQKKKISNDWSPTHQAWASTLRADTPTTTRPSTRASSPGSKTYQSSTSSLRSSVSPDKSRKPPSRGGSPSKTDRSSPSRYSTDHYSSTHSTSSVTETRNYQHVSPDRKPPVSPTRYGSSPDRKPDTHHQRPSQSPEKRPQDYRPSSSPERKPGYTRPADDYPKTKSPTRTHSSTTKPSLSPERRPYQPSESPSPVNNRTRPFTRDAPRSSASPGRKPGYQQPSPTRTSPDNPADRYVKESSPTQPSTSPDRKPGYMRPTAASVSPDRKSSTKQVPSQTERKTYGKSTIKEDHYKFIDEETKMYTRSDREDIKCTKKSSPGPRDKSPSPVSQIDEPDHCRAESPSLRPTLRKGSRSPSPPKGPVTFTDDQINKTDKIKTTTTNITTKYDEDITKTYRPTKPNSPTRDTPREPSPSKYGTYDKKRRTEETEEVTTIATQKDSKDLKYDSLKRQEVITKKTDIPTSPTKKTPRDSVSPVKPETPREPSPSKYGTYDKKRHTEEIITTTKDTKDVQYDTVVRTKSQSPNKIPDSPISPTKKSLRDSVSPVKSPTKDTKYKHTTDFITTERKSEEVNKKTTTKNRQLVTPSSSPTRKPMPKDTAPSTGQSSPTTSVSEFVYFSSPNTERTIVTDLDDEEYIYVTDKTEENTTILTQKRPETLPIQRSPSPSKIPCRSPSPEKRSPTKDSLPRKSSLKKPSSDKQISPVEKPPSNFRVSPADETKYFPEHKVVKKDRPDKPSDSTFKTKHPFERRETYEERCLKILGVVGDNTKTTEITKESPVESPCRSPKSKESSPFRTYSEVQDTTKTKVTDFITREQEDNIKKATNVSKTTTFDKKSKSPSRDSSPTKLQDIISQKPVNQDDKTTTVDVQENITAKIKHQSPDRDIGYQKPRASVSPEKKIPQGTKHDSSVRPSQSPDRKPGYQTSTESSSSDYLSNISSTKIYSTDSTLTRSSESPERKPDDSPTKTKPKTPSDKHPKGTSPTRSSVSPDRKPGYMSSTMGKYGITTTIDVQEDITSTTTRQSLDRETGYAKPKGRCPSPTKEGKPFKPESVKKRPSASPDRKPDRQPSPTKSSPESPDNQRSSVSPDRKPSYMRPTSSSVTKVESTHTREEVTEDKKTTESLRKQSYPQTPDQPSTRSPSKEPEKSKPNRTPSPSKKVTSTTTTEDSTLLIQTEREQEILDRVQQSLRKLSPAREQRSPSREKSPGKTTISLQNIDVVTSQTVKEEDVKISQKNTVVTDVTRSTKPANDSQKPTSKPPSRTVSPTKKPMPSKIPESANKSRSISPKKPVSPTERPPSPQVPKTNGMKPRDPTPTGYTRKPTSGSTSPTKIEKITTEVKKSGVTKQNSFTKTITKASSIPNKIEPDPKRTPAPKGINKENVSPKKEDVKVTRTASDASLKGKKPSPQRVKSKPEIQVNDLSPTRTTKTTVTKKTTTTIKEPKSTLAPKPKSATALNTTQDDDDTIITDVEQAKSSRENSPDRICPTPVSFLEDVGTPRYPDEVKEPDDEFRSRTHHIIHETESLVDDIVEISEDEELFVKNTEVNRVTGSDECLLSVTDKVSKFTNKIETVTKPKDSTSLFKDVERQVHSDFITEDLKSDECLLSVSEKVNKFAKGPQGKRDRSPARKIVDEYDTETVYQDDYTKLSVNDKAHLFVETAENTKASKTKPAQKVERPDLSNVDDSLKSDECLLSVSDKVNKFVKTAEQFLIESHEVDEKEKKVREQYDKFIKNIVKDEEDTHETQTETHVKSIETEVKNNTSEHKTPSFAKETASSHTKVKDFASPNLKPTEKTATVKITTLRSSEAVKKAKALFENIASTTQQSKDTKTTKLLDIGVIKKSPKTDSTIVLHPSVEDFPNEPESDVDAPREPTPKDRPSSATLNRQQRYQEKPRSSPTRLTTQSPEVPRTRSPMRQSVETTTTKTVLSRYPASQGQSAKPARPETDSSKILHPEQNKPQDNVPSYQKPTITSQVKEEKTVEEMEVSSRRGSGKFGVELRRTSAERSAASSERRRSSDHHQPCIEDIFDLDLLEQMLEKVVGYEQRRRIRAQIRVAKKKETELTDTTYTKHTVTKTRSPERRLHTKSPDRAKSTPQKTFSTEHPRTSTPIKTISDQTNHKQPTKPLVNGHAKEPGNLTEKRQRSPEKPRTVVPKTKSPVRQPSPDKRTRTTSPTKTVPKAKPNRFNEYASAYIRKVGLNETDKVKLFDKTKRAEIDNQKSGQTKFSKKSEDHLTSRSQFEEHRMETKTTSTSKSMSERTSSKDTIEVTQINGKRSPSPEKKRSPEHHTQSPSERLHQRTPSPDFKRKTDVNRKETITKIVYETEPTVTKKETIIKTVYEERPRVESSKKETVIKTIYDIEKKIPGKQNQEEKPSWMTSRNLKKTSAESRVVTRRAEEKRVASRPIDAIVSSYGPGPLDADGRPLFGIKALRNGSSNYQVKGTVVRSEYHSRNGGEPEGSVSVTAYSSEPAELERLLAAQGEPPSRIHGLAAITTTKKFGAGTGTSITQAHSKEERAALDQFTHSDRRVSADLCDVTDTLRKRDDKKEIAAEKRDARRMEERRERVERREDRKTVRQSSVKSLTEKYIKSASDTCKSERSAYPKAGLILRSANMKDSVSSDSSTHAGLGRTDSEHSLASVEDTRVVSPPGPAPARGDKSFLDSSSKVSGVQDILTRMKNADIVIQEGDSTEDSEARALLNKFLGASVLMAGMQAYVTEKPTGHVAVTQETVRSGGGRTITTTTTTTRSEDIDLDRCWDERLLRKLLEESTDYEQRRRIRARIRTLMAEQEACASAVTDALAASGAGAEADAREEEEVTVTSSVRRNSSEKTVSSSTTTKTSKVIESMTRPAPKPVSPFAKFRQLEKQNSVNSPNSPQTPQSPGSPAKAPFFKFTDPALQASALTIKERLLQWCRDKTRDYENVKLENFSTSWADGLAFCALLHHFLPDAFDYAQLSAQHRRHNFTLAFKVADEKAGIYPLLDVDDMVAMRKPDWKCVFTYVQAIHRRFKDQQ